MFLTPVAGVGPSGLNVVPVGTALASFSTTDYTFSSVNIGAASSDRIIIVCVGGNDDGGGFDHIDAVSVGGSAMTRVVEQVNQFVSTSIWIKAFAAGGTANTFVCGQTSTSMDGIGIQVFAVYGGMVSLTATSTTNDGSPSSGTLAASLVIPADGFGIGDAFGDQNGAGYGTWSWTNLTMHATQNVSHPGSYYNNFTAAYSKVPGTLTRTATLSTGSMNNGSACFAAFH